MDMLTNSQAVGFADMQEYCRHGRAATASPAIPAPPNPAFAPHQQPGAVDYSDGANVIGM
jgi:hypothetical protein